MIYTINKYYILLSDRPGRVLEQQLVMEPRTTRAKRQHPIPQNTAPETPETVSERMLWFLDVTDIHFFKLLLFYFCTFILF